MQDNKNKKQEVHNAKAMKVALFCIAAGVILYFGASFLKGLEMFSKRINYYSVFEYGGGIHPGAQIYVNGFKIGKVMSTEMVDDNPVTIVAEYLLTQDMQIPDDSRFEIVSDIMGGVKVHLRLGTSKTYMQKGDTLDLTVQEGLLDGIDGMKTQISSILTSVDSITHSLNQTLNVAENGKNSLTLIIENLTETTNNLNDLMGDKKSEIASLITNLNKFSATLANSAPQLEQIISKVDNIADTLIKANIAHVLNNTNETILALQEILEKASNGDGDVAKLLNEDQFYTSLTTTMNDLDKLLIDIKENPKKYINVTVFGGKEKTKNKKNRQSINNYNNN